MPDELQVAIEFLNTAFLGSNPGNLWAVWSIPTNGSKAPNYIRCRTFQVLATVQQQSVKRALKHAHVAFARKGQNLYYRQVPIR